MSDHDLPAPLPGADRSPLAAEPAPTAAEGDITIRALTADDRAVVERLHQQLSSTDAHLRFFGPRPKHLGDFADQLCCQDFKHLALGAFENGELVGVANYVVTDTTPGRVSAEIALAVSGHNQQHGIGTLLVRQLGTAAYFHGVARLTAEILAENTLMLAVVTEQGWAHALHHHGAVVHLDLELISPPQPHPSIPSMPQDDNAGKAIHKR